MTSAGQLDGDAVAVLTDLGSSIQWSENAVTDDEIYCVHVADDEDMTREHAHVPTS